MAFTIQTLVNYLGNPASIMLADAPFKNWAFRKSLEDDLDEVRVYYVFPQNGLEFLCDGNDEISTIFLYSDEHRQFDGDLLDLPFSSTRRQVIKRLGPASKSGNARNDPILGEYGPWDRFERRSYAIHVEFRVNADRVNKITLMRADAVP